MTSSNDIELYRSELFSSLEGSFELEPFNTISLNEAQARVESVIRELLDKNMEKLLVILYRIDVSQKVTNEVFSLTSKDDIASLLAEAVIKRQLEKIESRRKYKKDSK